MAFKTGHGLNSAPARARRGQLETAKGPPRHRGVRPRLRELTPVELGNLMEVLGEAGQMVMQVGHVMKQGFGVEWLRLAEKEHARLVRLQAAVADAFRIKYGHELVVEKVNPDSRKRIF